MIDFCLNNRNSCINKEMELIIQQIDLLYDTNPNEVLGSEHYGSNYDIYLHNLNISNEGLRQQILSDLSNIEMFGYNYDVQVYMLRATAEDIAIINIVISNDINKFEKTYKIV